VLVVVDHDLVPAVGASLEVTAVCGVCAQQRLECLRHRAHVHLAAQRHGKADEILGVRVELLAGRQIADRR